ncbi:hypothetical protein BHC46_03345 [Snodgrassella alvi]|jgi:hypothetical protein|uniref:VacJ n=1 Tax=Snodgrassella alvi TaxID=1196083 RepID=A0A2N9XK98_9NEIS|nr:MULTISPECIES: hypothetical protein [Snodgrassella]PIT11322.1 hypothetical protein BGI31_03170 [Snodgrassella communis]PIT20722.1 hypothetical protein BGI35_07700 [Snodgrassella communis]PIT21640.1 hypothetical protein BGI36_05815 [Snodgrassella communis]PIT48753.1 hypothetical protein BHC46_03345 [Snodgrassella alvi]
MYFVDRSAVVLKPAQAFLDWLQNTSADLPDLTLAQLQSNCTTLLVPEFETPEQVIGYIGERFMLIFEAELSGWEVDRKLWPAINIDQFWNFFTVEVHDMVLDLVDTDLQVSPVYGEA